MAVIDLQKVNKKKISPDSPSQDRVPSTVLQLDAENEKIFSSTGKGTAVSYTGYNVNKPNLNAPWAGQFSLGVGQESDNFAFSPSILLNPQKPHQLLIPHNLVASCADIRLRTFGSIAKNRSLGVINADIIQHRGNEIIELVVGSSKYRNNGTRIGSSGGVHVIKAGKENNLQPMVLGDNLSTVLTTMTDTIGNIITRVNEIRQDLITLKTALLVHTHIATGPGAPVSPSPDLIATVTPTFIKDGFEISNLLSLTINNEFTKLNHLQPFNKEKILSEDHKLT